MKDVVLNQNYILCSRRPQLLGELLFCLHRDQLYIFLGHTAHTWCPLYYVKCRYILCLIWQFWHEWTYLLFNIWWTLDTSSSNFAVDLKYADLIIMWWDLLILDPRTKVRLKYSNFEYDILQFKYTPLSWITLIWYNCWDA